VRLPATCIWIHQIKRRWEIVAGLAWKGYVAHGRGALLFRSSADGGADLPLDFVKGHPIMRECAHFLRRYDPTEQIVALFLTPPDRLNTYCGGLTPERDAPPEAYKRN
jgi:hypothetical protein